MATKIVLYRKQIRERMFSLRAVFDRCFIPHFFRVSFLFPKTFSCFHQKTMASSVLSRTIVTLTTQKHAPNLLQLVQEHNQTTTMLSSTLYFIVMQNKSFTYNHESTVFMDKHVIFNHWTVFGVFAVKQSTSNL